MIKLKNYFLVLLILACSCATAKQVNNIKDDISKINGSVKILSDAVIKNNSKIARLEDSLKVSDNKIGKISKEHEEMLKTIDCEKNTAVSNSNRIKILEAEAEDTSNKITQLSDNNTAMQAKISSLEAAKNEHAKMLKHLEEIGKKFVTHEYLKEVMKADDKIREAAALKDSLLIHIYYGRRQYELDKEQINYLIRALNDYDSSFDLKNYTLTNVFGFTSSGEKKDIGYLRAKIVLEKLQELNMVGINEGMTHSYEGKRGEQVIVILQKCEPPPAKATEEVPSLKKSPPETVIQSAPKEQKKATPSRCGRFLEYFPR